MNISVYNTNIPNNLPESGVFTTYRSIFDGTTIVSPESATLVVDDEYIYYPVPEYSYVSKNIQTVAVLDTDGNIISRVSPNCTPGTSFQFIGEDNNYLYCVNDPNLKIKNSVSSLSIFRINKNTYKIDPDFILNAWSNWTSRWMSFVNNKYYFGTSTNIYPDLNSNLNGNSTNIFILKNKKNICNLGRFLNTSNKIKVKDDNIYVAGRTPGYSIKESYSKIFRLNKNLRIDTIFNPYIERLNNTSTAAAGGLSSDVFDFDFDNEGIYIGGNFLTVGGEQRIGVAKINYSGNLISGFNANFPYSNNSNICRVVLTTGSGLFIAAAPTGIGGTQFSQKIFKLHNDGSINTGFSGRLSTNYASALAISGGSLYALSISQSPFANIGSGIAKMNAEDGSLDANFNCVLGSNLNLGAPGKLLISGENLYVCGDMFNPYRNQNNGIQHFATGIIKVRASDGNPDTGFKINFNSHFISTPYVSDAFIKGNELHIVGSFSGIEGTRINNYAIVDTTSGRLLDTQNYFLDLIATRAIGYQSKDDLIVIANAGNSTSYAENYNYNYNSRINAFDTGFNLLTGIQIDTTFFTNQSNAENQLLINGPTGYIISGFINNPNFVRVFNLETGGTIFPETTFNLSGDNSFLSIVRYNNDLYFGGYFDRIAGANFTGNRAGIVKTNLNGVIDNSFDLGLTGLGSRSFLVQNLKIINNDLYVFSSQSNRITFANSTGIEGGMIKYNLLTNQLDTGFNQILRGQTVRVRDIHNDSKNNLYMVFEPNTTAEYTGRNFFENSGHLFKFNSGSYIPNDDFSKKYFWLIGNINIINDRIFAPLRNTQKISGSNIYKINKKTRQILPNTVSIIGNYLTSIQDMYGSANSIYISGPFTGVNGIAKTGICKLNKNDLSIDPNFNLNIGTGLSQSVGQFPNNILETNNHLYFVGNFTTVSGNPHTGICRINKSNDALDQTFKIDYSGFSLSTVNNSCVISGNKMYMIFSTSPNFRILNLDSGRFEFTGTTNSFPVGDNILFGIENANGNLFLAGSSSSTFLNSQLIGQRGRGLFIAGYNSGELIPPYSSWSNSTLTTFVYPKYVSINNTVAVGNANTSATINNTSTRNTCSLYFVDANKLYIRNNRSVIWPLSIPNVIRPRFYEKSKYETYILYTNWLLPNPEDDLYPTITNNQHTRGVIKYDPIKERYDVII